MTSLTSLAISYRYTTTLKFPNCGLEIQHLSIDIGDVNGAPDDGNQGL